MDNNENETQNISNHRKSLLAIINETLLDNLSRYRRASEISEQALKLSNENSADNSVDGALVLMREVVPRESLSTLELIKGALLQSEIMKTISSTLPLRIDIVEVKDDKEDEWKFQFKNQPGQSLNKLNDEVQDQIQTPKIFNDILKQVYQTKPLITIKGINKKGETLLNGSSAWAPKKNSIIDKVVVQDNEQNNLKFRRYIEKINQFEEEYDLKITEIFKDKELFLKRTQRTSLPIRSVLDKKDKLLIIKLNQIFNNWKEPADLLKLQRRLIQSLVQHHRENRL